MPAFGVGGSGFPFVLVTSWPVCPPRGPTCSYCPLTFVGVPDLIGFPNLSYFLPSQRSFRRPGASVPEKVSPLYIGGSAFG